MSLVQKRTIFDANDILAVWCIHAHKRFAPDSFKSKFNLIAISPRFSRSYDIAHQLGSLFRREVPDALECRDNSGLLLAKLGFVGHIAPGSGACKRDKGKRTCDALGRRLKNLHERGARKTLTVIGQSCAYNVSRNGAAGDKNRLAIGGVCYGIRTVAHALNGELKFNLWGGGVLRVSGGIRGSAVASAGRSV